MSSIYFRQGFELHEHPARVTIDMAEAHIWDQSGGSAVAEAGRFDQLIEKRLGGAHHPAQAWPADDLIQKSAVRL